MAKGYKRYGGGGQFKRSNISDLGIGELRFRDQNIIDSIKLQRKQHEQRSTDFIQSTKRAQDVEAGVSESLQQLEDKKYQTRREALNVRAKREVEALKQQAKNVEAEAAPWVKLSETIASVAGKAAGVYAKEAAAKNAAQQATKGINAVIDTQQVSVNDWFATKSWNETWNQVEEIQGNDAFSPYLKSWFANKLISSDPSLFTHNEIGGVAQGLTTQVKSDVHEATSLFIQLQTKRNLPTTRAGLEEFLNQYIGEQGQKYNLVDENGDWRGHKDVSTYLKAWNNETNRVITKWGHQENIRTANNNIATQRQITINDPSIYNVEKLANIYSRRPTETNPNLIEGIKAGYTYAFEALAQNPNIDTQDIKILAATIETKGPDGKPMYPKYKKGESEKLLDRFGSQWLSEVIKKRTAFTRAKKAEVKANIDLEDQRYFSQIVYPMLTDPQNLYDGRDLSEQISEVGTRLGKDSISHKALVSLQSGSTANYDTKKTTELIKWATRTFNHDILIEHLTSEANTPEARAKLAKNVLPILKDLSGFNYKDFRKSLKTKLLGGVKIEQVTQIEPASLTSAINGSETRIWEKAEVEYAAQKRGEKSWEKAVDDATAAVYKEIESKEGLYKIEIDGSGAGEYINFLPGRKLPEFDPYHRLSEQEFTDLIKEKGVVAAWTSPGVFTDTYLEEIKIKSQRNESIVVSQGIPNIINEEGELILSREQILEKGLENYYRKLGLKNVEIDIPDGLVTTIQKDPNLDKFIKKAINSTRSLYGTYAAIDIYTNGGSSNPNNLSPEVKGALGVIMEDRELKEKNKPLTANPEPNGSYSPYGNTVIQVESPGAASDIAQLSLMPGFNFDDIRSTSKDTITLIPNTLNFENYKNWFLNKVGWTYWNGQFFYTGDR